ncbi:MAG: response regulator [Eubacteriales bacterium]
MIKIIIVEDESLVREGILYGTDWSSIQCEVIGDAKDGLEGYEMIKNLSPDIVITDIQMPKMTGLEMIESLRKDSYTCKFIILTAYSDFTYAQSAVKLDVSDYLLKPFEDGELEESIQQIISILPQHSTTPFHFKAKSHYNSKYINEAIEYIQNHYAEHISISQVSYVICLSEGYFSRLFKKETGYTFVNYLAYYRIEQATKLLQNHKVKVYEVAQLVGYSDSMYFSNLFKKIVGVSPSQYQEKSRP